MNMSKQRKPKCATAKQNVLVEEVEKVWGTLITQERKDWTTQHLEGKLRKEHNRLLTQEAAVKLAKRDRRVERMVTKHKLEMRAPDLAWACSWVAQKVQDGQAVGEVFRPELGR